MTLRNETLEVLAVTDEETERPIPSAWRWVIREIVGAFVRYDYQISAGIPGVAQVSAETAAQIQNYIQDYGATLVDLPEETWNSSVCIWMGTEWNALIDLWTASEGRSDLVLSLRVAEDDDDFLFHIYMVYVP
jgi:hypothetical protein